MPVPHGFVPTPPAVADYMAKTMFVEPPREGDRILFPGAGTGCLAAAVRRYCSVRDYPCPDGVAVDTSAERLAVLEEHVASATPAVPPLSTRSKRRLRSTYPTVTPSQDHPVGMTVQTQVADFLLDPPRGKFDYILANPPYTRYEELDREKREQYRESFRSATGRFALYMPFVEQMQRLLADDGQLVFIAPVNYLLADYATAFRQELRRDRLEAIMCLPGAVFPGIKLETVVTTASADTSLGRDGHFWLESFDYLSVVDELLQDIGVVDEERRERLVDDYFASYESSRTLLRRRQHREGEDGGYNVDRIPTEYRPEDSYQGDLGRWVE